LARASGKTKEALEERPMISDRSIDEVVDDGVTILLPLDFAAKRVEMIILPAEEDRPEPSRLQRLLLAAPTASEADLDAFAQTSEWMNRFFEAA
jgi:hypothetical protein